MSRSKLPPLAAALLLAPLALAAEGAPAFAGLAEPEVIKSDWNQRGLLQADIDGDGRMDLAFLNNDKARVEILLQKEPGAAKPRRGGALEGQDRWTPRLEDSRFESAPLTTATVMYDLACGDVNGDGRTDIVISEKSTGLHIYLQQEGLTWSDPVKIDVKNVVNYLGLLHVHDLDGNGKAEIVASSAKTLFFHEHDGKGRYPVVRKLNHSEENLHGLRFLDLNGDKRTDLQLCSTDQQYSLRVRLQEKSGDFGPELMIRQDAPEGILSVGTRKGEKAPFFAMLQKTTGMIELFRLAPPAKGAAAETAFSIEAFSAPVADKDKPVLTAWGDLDGNGRPDLAVSDFTAAQVHVYFQDERGKLSPSQAFPSFSSISSLAAADTDGDGRAELFLASASEEILGTCRLGPEGRLTFPTALPLEGIPTAVAVADIEGDRVPEIVCATRADKKYRVVLFKPVPGDRDGHAWHGTATNELSTVSHDIERILPVDLNQDGRLDLVLAANFKPLQILLQTNALAFGEVKDLSGYSRSLLAKVNPAGLSVQDVNADGKPELLVTRKGYVRALRMAADAQLEVVEQLNASEPDVEVDAVFAIQRGDKPAFLLADSGHNCFEVLARDGKGVFALEEKIRLPNVRIKGGLASVDAEGRPSVFLTSDDKFWRVRFGEQAFVRERLSTHETDLPDVVYGGIELGDLNADGDMDIVAVDTTQTRVLEVLSIGENWSPVSRFHFKVFDVEPGQRQPNASREPKELIIGDFTGDGRNDIAILIHDRVLVYPQP